MARIPRFTQKVFLNRSNAGNIATAGAEFGIEAAEHRMAANTADRNAAQAGNIANEIVMQKKAEGKLSAQQRWNETKRGTIETENEMRMKAQSDPSGYADAFDKYHREQSALVEEEIKLGETNKPFDLELYRQLADRDRTQAFQRSSDFENGQRVKNTFTGAETAIDDMNVNNALSNPSYKDMVAHFERIKNYTDEVGKDIFSPQDNVALTEFGVDGAAKEFLFEKLQQDPKELRRVLEYGQGGRDFLTDFIMTDIEGGAKIAQEPDGAIAKYGINSIAYGKRHGIGHEAAKTAVRNLSNEDAAKELKNNYYDPKLDGFDPAFQAVAYDALVNHGNDKDTWSMINKANGDPYSLIVLRGEKYAGLIESNPEKYAKYGAGWKARMDEMAKFSDTMNGGGSEFLKHTALIDSGIIGKARNGIPKALADKEKSRLEAIEIENATDVFTQRQNEQELNKILFDENLPYEQKIVALRRADFSGSISDKWSSEAESLLKGIKAKDRVEYDPNAIADLRAKKELFFNKRNKDGLRTVTVSPEMLDDVGDMMVTAMRMQKTGEILPSESKALLTSLGIDLAAAGKSIGGLMKFNDTHDETAFRYFRDVTDDAALRNKMFREYTEQSETLDEMESTGVDKKQIKKEGNKIIQDVVRQVMSDDIPAVSSMDKMSNNIFRTDGKRIFVGGHTETPKADANVTLKRKLMVDGAGNKAWVYDDGTIEEIK